MSWGSSSTDNGFLRPINLDILIPSLRWNEDHQISEKLMSLTDEKIIAMYALMVHCIPLNS